MSFRRYTLAIIGVLVGCAWVAGPAAAQERTALPSRQHATVRPTADVALESLPSVDAAALRAEDRERADRISPYRYGTVVETRLQPRSSGTWERLPGGHWLWRLRLQSRNAVSLSVAFGDVRLPPGTRLYVYGQDKTHIRGPYTQKDVTGGTLRTPIVRSDEATIELDVPADARPDVQLAVERIVHGYRPLPRSAPNAEAAKSGDCNIDVACNEADPWRRQVRSVAGYGFTRGEDALFCSGSLVNNTAEDRTPFFLTAEHCVQSEEEARNMVFYWNYQNQSCRSPGSADNGTVTSDNPLDQTSTGAILRARYGSFHQNSSIAGKPDLTLVEIDEEIPLDYQVYFNGWSWEDRTTQKSVTIHHPSGHGKRISFDQDPTSITGYATQYGGATHLRVGNWERGTTEGGSSGSPLFDTDKRVVGVLSGGVAGCGTGTSGAQDNNEPDWYGRLHAGFDRGDYEGTTIADWLDPTNSGTRVLDGLPQKDISDSTPPARIEDLTVANVDTTSMTLTWTSAGDDGNQGTSLRYELRYASFPITSASDFSSATQAVDTPTPKVAGTEQSAVVRGLVPDTTYYFAIRSIDDGLNPSPIGMSKETLLPDKIAPASVQDFQLVRVNTSNLTIKLKWKATGDDRRRGSASAYELRYASSPIETKTDFSNATPVTGLPRPADASTTETFELNESNGLERNASYHFALRAVDNAGNASPPVSIQQKAVLTKDITVTQGTAAASQEVRFVVKETQNVRVVLYDLLGRQVTTLFDREVQEGFERAVHVDATQLGLSSGPYFVRFNGETFTETRKITVVN